MSDILNVSIADDVLDFLKSLSSKDAGKIMSAINAVGEKRFDSVFVKQISGEIKELKIRKYRVLFFILSNTVHFVRIFIKKTNKIPKQHVEFALKYYKLFINL
jgi:phage-related protein